MMGALYEDKSEEYYGHIRKEILPLLPDSCQRILEVGCGSGDTLRWVKSIKPDCQWIGGIELFPEVAQISAKYLDWSCAGNIEELDLSSHAGPLDVTLCLDVLERLVDPWVTVQKLHKLLKPGACIVASIPNIRFFKVVFNLMFLGNWKYEAESILDRTHLRFFTKKTALELMQCSGLKFKMVTGKGLEQGRKARWINIMTLGIFRSFLEFQYLIRVK